jgi:hypothetical protein
MIERNEIDRAYCPCFLVLFVDKMRPQKAKFHRFLIKGKKFKILKDLLPGKQSENPGRAPDPDVGS